MAAPGDLCTLAEAEAQLRRGTTDTETRDVLERMISAASELMRKEARREFAPVVTETRTIRYRGGRFLDLAPWDLQIAPASSFAILGSSPYTWLAGDVMLGSDSDEYGVASYLEFLERPLVTRSSLVEISGTWGFPTIPPSIRHLCATQVAIWARRDLDTWSATFSLDENRLERPESLASAVRAGLSDWRRRVIP